MMTHPSTRPRWRILGAAAALACVAACTTVGPDYTGAPSAAPDSVARAAFLRADAAATAAAPVARWWETLDDPVLSQLVDDALANAPSIAAANARIAQSRAGLAINRSAAIPSIGTSIASPYVNAPGNILDKDSDKDRIDAQRFAFSFDASWELDLFGGTRRTIEAASARAQATEAGLADAQVSLSAEIARAYVALRARQAALEVLQQQDGIDTQLTALASQRFAQGTASRQPLEQMRAQQAQTRAQLASVAAEITLYSDQISLLAGREPGAFDVLLHDARAIPLPPRQIAIGDPAQMLRNRPDIRIAERQLAAANEDIGANIADKFPKISFLGLLGLGTGADGNILDPGEMIGLALPRLSWNLFDGGRTDSRIAASRGAFAEAEAKYRASVLAALNDAEASLTRFASDRIELGQAIAAQASGATIASLQHQRAAAGTISRAEALSADRRNLDLKLAEISARAGLTSDFIGLNKALGLGWESAGDFALAGT